MNSGHRILSPNKQDPELTDRCALAIMTKAPLVGRVKTRLTPPLTPEEAAALNRCFLRDTATAIGSAGTETRGIGCYEPVGSEEIYRDILPSDFALLAQREASFGHRLCNAAVDLFSLGSATVCLIGSDNPLVPTSTYTEATRLLSQPDDCLVLGPSEDGGYYLLGMKRVYPSLFENISWSTDQVFEETLTRAAELNLPVHLLPVCLDVDDQVSLQRLCEKLLSPEKAKLNKSAPATKAFLENLIKREGRDRIWPANKSSSAMA